MITFLMSFRGYSKKNLEGFDKMLESLTNNFSNMELLIKLDSDDTLGIEHLKYRKLSFIKPFIFNRWEGRWTINYFYEYLFLHKNSESKYISMLTDDITLTKNFENDLDDTHLIFGDYQEEVTKESLDKIGNLSERKGLTSNYICSYPIISSKLVEITGNFGYQSNPDSHLALLNIIMYQKYGIILAKHIEDFVKRDNIDRLDNYGIDFNKENLVSDSDMLKYQ